MKILAIETSCDETAVSILEAEGDISNPRFRSLSDIILSQIDVHSQYGGVFPSLAKREHANNIIAVIKKVLEDAGLNSKESSSFDHLKEDFVELFSHEEGLAEEIISFLEKNSSPDIDAVAVTYGPGLEPALWVGINVAKALSEAWNKPLIPVNHLEGHIASVLFNKAENKENRAPELPMLAILISGGHTEYVKVKEWGRYEYLGGTVDDAVGEAFDKVARLLGLPYPGGPPLSDLAKESREKGGENPFMFPRPMKDSGDLNLSFSGLKTAVLYAVKDRDLSDRDRGFVAEAFEDAVVDILKIKARKALKEGDFKTLTLCGGVSANRYIRSGFQELSESMSTPLLVPDISLSTDNASMIALAGYITIKTRDTDVLRTPDEIKSLTAEGNLRLG